MTQAPELTGMLFTRLLVVERAGSNKHGQATWLCQCVCGTTITTTTGQLRLERTKSCGCWNTERIAQPKPDRQKTVVPYRTAHARIQRRRGRASNHRCADCGSPASHWSYDGTDPDALVNESTGCQYSLDVNHYAPRCVPCHRSHDSLPA